MSDTVEQEGGAPSAEHTEWLIKQGCPEHIARGALTTVEGWTAEQYRAAKDALFAQEGACNGSGVAHSLVEAYKAWLHIEGTDAANKSPPVLLMLHQLAHLAGYEFNAPTGSPAWYEVATDACEKIVKEYEEANG